MKNIPSEIILHILKQVQLQSEMSLLTCALVCKRWSFLALELLWHKPNFKTSTYGISFFTTIQSNNQLYPYTSFIKRINLTPLAKQVEDIHFMTLNACQRLERLTLAGCSQLTDVGLCALIQKDQQTGIGYELISIDLSDVIQVTDQTIFKIASCCPQLQGLNLSMNQENHLITDTSIMALAKNCNNLKRIKLNNCVKISEQSAISLATHCPNLVEMDFMNCNINDQALQAICMRSKELRELRLSQSEVINTRITSQAILSTASFHQLRLVDLTAITSITDTSLDLLINSAPKIKSLVLNKCFRITDVGVTSICKLGRFLHHLHLGHCSHITDQSIIQLSKTCTRLRYLDMACCTNLTDRSMMELASNLSKLKRIGLVKCINISDRSLVAFCKTFSLERIHLSYCTQLSVKAVARLLNSCHQLNHLSLTNVPSFLREDLQRYCRVPPQEFTDQQRRPFCVYSGKGVHNLKDYLNSIGGGGG